MYTFADVVKMKQYDFSNQIGRIVCHQSTFLEIHLYPGIPYLNPYSETQHPSLWYTYGGTPLLRTTLTLSWLTSVLIRNDAVLFIEVFRDLEWLITKYACSQTSISLLLLMAMIITRRWMLTIRRKVTTAPKTYRYRKCSTCRSPLHLSC